MDENKEKLKLKLKVLDMKKKELAFRMKRFATKEHMEHAKIMIEKQKLKARRQREKLRENIFLLTYKHAKENQAKSLLKNERTKMWLDIAKQQLETKKMLPVLKEQQIRLREQRREQLQEQRRKEKEQQKKEEEQQKKTERHAKMMKRREKFIESMTSINSRPPYDDELEMAGFPYWTKEELDANKKIHRNERMGNEISRSPEHMTRKQIDEYIEQKMNKKYFKNDSRDSDEESESIENLPEVDADM
jgi:hypothetical protein